MIFHFQWFDISQKISRQRTFENRRKRKKETFIEHEFSRTNLQVSHSEQRKQREGDKVEEGRLGSLENLRRDSRSQEPEEVANERAVEVGHSRQGRDRRLCSQFHVHPLQLELLKQLCPLVRVVAHDEAEQQPRHHLHKTKE